jgi:aerobic carbon-monoxide dehydrogenase large subunit
MTTRYAGARINRVEDARLLTGRGTFVDDVVRPGMLHACFVRSPFARARINGVDAADALALPGVHAVFTAADLNPDVREAWFTSMGKDMPDSPKPPLAAGEARFVGDPVALVVAIDRYVAEDAADLVVLDLEPLPAVVDYESAADSEHLVHEAYPGNMAAEIGGAPPETVAADFDAAPHVLSVTIRQQAYAPVPLECRGIVAEWEAATGELTVWSATQAPHEVRMFGARLLGIPEHSVRVIARDTGGGFGQKVLPMREDMAILLAARKVRGPLKWIEDRRENLLAAGQSRHEQATVRVALDNDGTWIAAEIDHLQDCGAYPMPWPMLAGAAVGAIFPGPYRLAKARFGYKGVYTNTVGRTAYRGPWQFESVAREVALDLAARQAGIDPIELRRRNLLRRDELPYRNPTAGMQITDVTPLETFDHAIEILDLDAFRAEQAAALAAGRHLGMGTCTYVEPTSSGQGFYGTEGATIRIEPSGAVNVYTAGGSAGNSTETAVVQLVADALGVDMADVHTIQGDTALTPFGAGTAGSRSGSMIAGAVAQTAAVLRERIIAIAAHRLEAAPDDIELGDSRATVRGTPAIGVSLAEVAQAVYFNPASLPQDIEASLEASGRYHAQVPNVWANATHVCTCEVDVETGVVTLLRYIVSEDCGPMINPAVVEGQIAGGTVQGIGGVLYEHLAYDDDGNPLTSTFMDYLLPTIAEVPVLEYGHVETPSGGPGGYKGVGEGGAIGAPPAVINAVADALAPLGVTITDLPLSPAAVRALIEKARPR